jgi:hypothetical protein
MKHIKYTVLIIIALAYSKGVISQQVITASPDSCTIEKDKDTFLIKLVKNGVTIKQGYTDFSSFSKKCSEIFYIDKKDFINGFKALDTDKNKLDTIADKMASTTIKYSYLIKKINLNIPQALIPPPPPPPPSPSPIGESINKKWFLLFLIIPLILMLFFRKKIGSILIPKDKKVAPQTETPDENDATTLTKKVHVIHNNEMDSNNISESDLKKENVRLENQIKELRKQNNEQPNKIKKYEDEIDRLQKSIKSKDESIKNHQTELAAELAKQKEQYENKLSTLKNDHENTLNKYKEDLNNQNKKHEEKLLTIIKENKQFDEIVSKIYEKYQFLNDERKYDNNFDLGQIVEATYFFNSATKNYVLKLPVLFNMEFKSQGILSKSDKANLDYLLTSNIANNVLVADEDSVKRNQDLSKFITDLRKKLVEAKVKDVSNVIIENHRIKL